MDYNQTPSLSHTCIAVMSVISDNQLALNSRLSCGTPSSVPRPSVALPPSRQAHNLLVDEVHTEKVQQHGPNDKVCKRSLMRYRPELRLVFRVRLHAKRGCEDELANRCAKTREEGVEGLQQPLAPSNPNHPNLPCAALAARPRNQAAAYVQSFQQAPHRETAARPRPPGMP